MAEDTTAQEATTEAQAAEGQHEAEQPKTTLTPEAALAALEATRKEAAETRRKLREAEGKLTAAERAQAELAEKQAAEQGRFKELFEAEKAKAAAIEARLIQMEHDGLRKDAAQAAGIPQLWQRLQGATAEELAEDARALAAFLQPAQPDPAQPARAGTKPTPQAQGRNGLTDEERRRLATRTF